MRWKDVRLECYGRRQGRRLSLGVVRDFKFKPSLGRWMVWWGWRGDEEEMGWEG